MKNETENGREINITLHTVPLPDGIYGGVTQDKNGGYAVFVNADKTEDEQAAAFLHEMLHVYRRDLEAPAGITAAEIEAEHRAALLRAYSLEAEKA